ncbi:MAG: hypothetical protein R3C61_26795 [Bacteroidia bacterium]
MYFVYPGLEAGINRMRWGPMAAYMLAVGMNGNWGWNERSTVFNG